jgi:hypothetical protein
MLKRILYFLNLLLLWSLTSCQNNTSEKSQTTPSKKDAMQSVEGFVSSEQDFVITPTERPNIHVIGTVYQKVNPETVKTLFIGTAPALTKLIADSGRIITGPIMAIYDKLPQKEVPNTIFVGIPIDKPLKSNTYGFINLPEGRYHKAKTMSELGASANYWSRVADKLSESGFDIQPPFIEYPSDTRTGEMTTVLTYSNLLILEKKLP